MFDQTFSSDWWQEDRAGLFHVTGGTNTFGIRENWGFYDIDWLEFRPFTPPAITPIAAQLTDPNADHNTRLLMNYMASLYGHKTLSGHQHEESDDAAFPSTTFTNRSGGLHPAIRSTDLMEYSPTRRQYGADPNEESEQSIEWAKETGGIVSLTWHWNAPDDLVNAGDWPWWRGFYTDGTTFNLPAALADTESEDYDAIIRDIDAIADELQKFEDEGVPVIWRPLHEAQGGWFWWGAHGPETFKDLWQLMHDRMTNVHGLHNLIWEFTSSAATGNHLDWYPGDQYVDMVSLDVYTDPASSMSGEWYDTLEHYDGRKMIALSESGTLPNADQMEAYGIAWSYYSLWKDGFLDDFTPAQVQALMGDEDVITLDELMTMPWSNAAPALPGDDNGDDTVNSADYTVWRDAMTAGSTSLPNDLTPGEVNDFDFEVWRTFFGQSLGGGAGAAAVPEPASLTLFLMATFWLIARRH
jgi:mannan endo-1,4-beta-mannosidase